MKPGNLPERFLRGNWGEFDRRSNFLYIFGLKMVNPQ